jgi:hypothetical protein
MSDKRTATAGQPRLPGVGGGFPFRGRRRLEGHGTSPVYPSTGLSRGNVY